MNDIVVPVSIFVKDLKNAVEGAFGFVALRGELTNLTRAYSGHLYFTLKEGEAQIKCALFKNRQKINRCELKPDEEYIVYGKISVYEARTEITLAVSLIIPYGEGTAAARLKMLKEKLRNEGVFDAVHKKSLPKFPKTIGVVTAENGAAIHDVITTSRKKFPPAEIILSPSLVQGKEADLNLIRALERVSAIEEVEAIIIGRGGGLQEDLEPFNSEELARAVIKSPKPVVSAVGHETDVTILDLAASFSVATPTAAAELIFPDSSEILSFVSNSLNLLKKQMESEITSRVVYLDNLTLSLKNPSEIIQTCRHKTESLLFKAQSAVREIILKKFNRLAELEKGIEANNPLSPLARGFAIVSQNGKTVKSKEDLHERESFEIGFKDGKKIINPSAFQD